MTARWQKTSEAVKTISAEKVRIKIYLSQAASRRQFQYFLRKFRLFSKVGLTFFGLIHHCSAQDIASFISAITIPDYVPVTRHNFAPPPPKEVTKVELSFLQIPHNAFCRYVHFSTLSAATAVHKY